MRAARSFETGPETGGHTAFPKTFASGSGHVVSFNAVAALLPDKILHAPTHHSADKGRHATEAGFRFF
jgi:hypothetical protein